MPGKEQSLDTGQEEENINAVPNMQMQEEENSHMTRVEDVGTNVDMENYEEYQRQERPMNKEEVFMDKQRRSEVCSYIAGIFLFVNLKYFWIQTDNNRGQMNEVKNPPNLQEQKNSNVGQQQSNTDNEIKEPRRLDRNNNIRTRPADDVEYDYDDDGNLVRYHTENNRFSKDNTRNVAYLQQNRMPYGIGRADNSR